MKKLLFLFAATALVWSCGDDDSSGSALKPSSITLQNGDGEPFVRTFTYDNKNRLQTMSADGSTSTFAYNSNGSIASVTTQGEDPVIFTYDGNGELESFGSGDSVYQVTQLGDNTFSVSGQTYKYNSNGDWDQFNSYTFTYESGKGPFANVKKLNGLALAVVDSESFLYASRKKLDVINSGGTLYPVTVTAGDNGLPAQYAVSEINMQFTYSD